MLYSEKHRNSTAGPLVLRGDSSSNSGPSPSTASSFPFLFWLASRGKPLELEIQIPTAVGIQNSAILLVSASPSTTAQAKACMSGASRRKFKSWFLTAICPCGFQPGSGWLFRGRRVSGAVIRLRRRAAQLFSPHQRSVRVGPGPFNRLEKQTGDTRARKSGRRWAVGGRRRRLAGERG